MQLVHAEFCILVLGRPVHPRVGRGTRGTIQRCLLDLLIIRALMRPNVVEMGWADGSVGKSLRVL